MSELIDAFCLRIVADLVRAGRLVVVAGAERQVAAFAAAHLAARPEGASLVSSLSSALLACPEVEELYCDDLELRDRITDLG
jgi:hypothetical protein